MPSAPSGLRTRRKAKIPVGASKQRFYMFPLMTNTRLSFSGRSTGTVTIQVYAYRVDDENIALDALPEGDFEPISNGTIDLSQRKTIYLKGEFSAIMITDNGNGSELTIDIHQLSS